MRFSYWRNPRGSPRSAHQVRSPSLSGDQAQFLLALSSELPSSGSLAMTHKPVVPSVGTQAHPVPWTLHSLHGVHSAPKQTNGVLHGSASPSPAVSIRDPYVGVSLIYSGLRALP